MTSLSRVSVDINYPREKYNNPDEVETSLMQKPERIELFPTTYRELCEDVFAIQNADQLELHTMSPEDILSLKESREPDDEE